FAIISALLTTNYASISVGAAVATSSRRSAACLKLSATPPAGHGHRGHETARLEPSARQAQRGFGVVVLRHAVVRPPGRRGPSKDCRGGAFGAFANRLSAQRKREIRSVDSRKGVSHSVAKWWKVGRNGAAGPAMFRGASKVSLDAKGRLAIPSRYRERITTRADGNLVATVDRDYCLLIYPLPDWEEIERKLVRLPSLNKQV